MGDGIDSIQYTTDITSSNGATVKIEGTNRELIQYLQMYVVTVMKQYEYNGIPEELQDTINRNGVKINVNSKV